MNTANQAFELVADARLVSTPIVTYSTPDAPASQLGIWNRILADEIGQETEPAAVQWDTVRGFLGLNEPGLTVAQKAGGQETINATDALQACARMPERSIVFFHNAHFFWAQGSGRAGFLQGLSNLRDLYKSRQQMIVCFHPGGPVPMEIDRDVVPIAEPLPGGAELAAVVDRVCETAHDSQGMPLPSDEEKAKAAGALAGTSLFTAEQFVSMSLRKTGINLDAVLARVIEQIRNTPGLAVEVGEEGFEGIAGNENIKRYFGMIKTGKKRPKVIVFLDEIEKQIAGFGTDTSGNASNQVGTVLQEMTDTKARGIILYGHAGTGKTQIAKALARELGAFVLRLKLGDARDRFMGGSEQRLAAIMAIIRAIGQGSILWIATSNGLANLPAELKSRFTLGTFFFDLPTEEERDGIWRVHLAASGLPLDSPRPKDAEWTGREIAACAQNAADLGVSLIEAARYIVPTAASDPDSIIKRRMEAHKRYISASYDGPYLAPGTLTSEAEVVVTPAAARALGRMRES